MKLKVPFKRLRNATLIYQKKCMQLPNWRFVTQSICTFSTTDSNGKNWFGPRISIITIVAHLDAHDFVWFENDLHLHLDALGIVRGLVTLATSEVDTPLCLVFQSTQIRLSLPLYRSANFRRTYYPSKELINHLCVVPGRHSGTLFWHVK